LQGVLWDYLVTFRVTVFEDAFPFFGVTVTVTLHDPVFSPFRLVPETLQNFAELATTFSDTFDVERTFNFANEAIDLADFCRVNTRVKT
jgi:hypothetical protein